MPENQYKNRLVIAYLKKKLGIVSPSVLLRSERKIRYEYDWLKLKRED